MRPVLAAAALAAALLVASGGTAGADPLDPLGYVRVLHGDLAVAGRPVAVAVDGQPAGPAPWAGASPWRAVAPGRHRMTATGGTDATVDVGPGCGVTLITGQADLNPASRRVVIIPDCNPARIGPDQARITAVVVTSPSFGPVEVEVNGGRMRVEPHTVVAGTVVKAGTTRVTISDPKTGAVFLQRDTELQEGTASTLALVGGGEAGVTLAVVPDATQARAAPAPGQPIHTGVARAGTPIPIAVVAAGLLAAVVVAGLARRRRNLIIALVVSGLVFTGCTRQDRPAVLRSPVDQPRTLAVPQPGPTPRAGTPAPPVLQPPPAGPTATTGALGAPAATPPASLRISRLGLDLPVGRLDGVDGLPGSLPLHRIAWLTGTVAAGADGTMAVVGHTGRGPFGRLGAVRPADELAVTGTDGRSRVYRVVSVSAHRKNAFPQNVWAPQRVPTLVLITCTGGRNPKTGLHVDNFVVRAIEG